MPNTKTIELTGSETEVRFDENYPYFWVRNFGDGDVLMSLSPNVVPDADGVTVIPAGEGRSSGDVGQAKALYFLGSGKIEVIPQHNAVCPFFKPAGKGGDGGGSVDLTGYARKEDIPDVSDFVSNPDDSTILVAKGRNNNPLSIGVSPQADVVKMSFVFPQLNTGIQLAFTSVIPAATSIRAGVMTAADKAKLDELSIPQLLKSDTDLNDITKPGFYYCPSNSVVTTFKNCPTNIAFSLLVEEHVGCGQTLTEWRKDEFRIYHRNGGADNIYGNWERLYTSADPPANATESADGFMSAADKAKLDSITPEMLEKLRNL